MIAYGIFKNYPPKQIPTGLCDFKWQFKVIKGHFNTRKRERLNRKCMYAIVLFCKMTIGQL